MNKHEGEGNTPEEPGIEITKEDIGKYITYELLSTENTFKAKKEYSGYDTDKDYVPTEGLKWRILSKEGNKVELISETGDNNQLWLRSYQGYNNSVALLNNACNKMYVNKELGAISARNLKIEDIEAHYTGEISTLEEKTSASGKYYPEIFALEEGQNVGNGYGSIGRSEMPSDILNGEGYIEQGQEKQAVTLRGKQTYNAFTITGDNMNKNGEDGNLYTSLFNHKTAEWQWFASRCVNYSDSGTYFNILRINDSNILSYHLYDSNNNIYSQGFVLRPIVTIDLNSVKLEGEGTQESPYTITKG